MNIIIEMINNLLFLHFTVCFVQVVSDFAIIYFLSFRS